MNKPRIILWDLETLPDLKEVMKVLPGIGQWPGRTLKASINSIICFGYKELGEAQAHCINAWDVDPDAEVNDDSYVVHAAYEVLKDADAIVTHNGKKFDLKVLNTRLVKYGLPPLHKINHVDTKVVAKRLMLYSNRLGDVSNFLGGESKLENGGWDLWCKVVDKDPAARKLMAEYCKQDVQVLEQVYNGLRPLMLNTEVPNYNLFSDDSQVCTNCGSHNLQKNGTRLLTTGKRQRYLCGDCGTSMDVKVDSKQILKASGV